MAVVKLVLDDVELKLGSEGLANILFMRDFDETQASAFLIRLLETSKSASVKATISGWFKMPAEVVNKLLSEDIYEVTESLVNNKDAVQHIPADWFYELIKSNNSTLIVDLFANVEYMKLVDFGEVSNLMASHPDPKVRKALATNDEITVSTLKLLINDEDPEVRELACATWRDYKIMTGKTDNCDDS